MFHFSYCILPFCLVILYVFCLLTTYNFLLCASSLLPISLIFFMIITLNCFSVRLPVSMSLCSPVVWSYSFIWNIFLCHLILSKLLFVFLMYVVGWLCILTLEKRPFVGNSVQCPRGALPSQQPGPAGPRLVSGLHLVELGLGPLVGRLLALSSRPLCSV